MVIYDELCMAVIGRKRYQVEQFYDLVDGINHNAFHRGVDPSKRDIREAFNKKRNVFYAEWLDVIDSVNGAWDDDAKYNESKYLLYSLCGKYEW